MLIHHTLIAAVFLTVPGTAGRRAAPSDAICYPDRHGVARDFLFTDPCRDLSAQHPDTGQREPKGRPQPKHPAPKPLGPREPLPGHGREPKPGVEPRRQPPRPKPVIRAPGPPPRAPSPPPGGQPELRRRKP